MPMAEISGARRKEPRRGRYATRSMVQFHSAVTSMAPTSMTTKASATLPTPSTCVTTRNRISPTKADSMNTSPWAKFTMPMMPNTMV